MYVTSPSFCLFVFKEGKRAIRKQDYHYTCMHALCYLLSRRLPVGYTVSWLPDGWLPLVSERHAKNEGPGYLSGGSTFHLTAMSVYVFREKNVFIKSRQTKYGRLWLFVENFFFFWVPNSASEWSQKTDYRWFTHNATWRGCPLWAVYCFLLKQVFLTCSPNNFLYSLGVISKVSKHDLTLQSRITASTQVFYPHGKLAK